MQTSGLFPQLSDNVRKKLVKSPGKTARGMKGKFAGNAGHSMFGSKQRPRPVTTPVGTAVRRERARSRYQK